MRRHDRRRALRRRGNPREGQQLAAPHAQIRTRALQPQNRIRPLHRGRFMARPRQALARRGLPGQQLSEKLHRLRPNGAARRPRAAALLRVGDGKRRAARPLPRGRRARRSLRAAELRPRPRPALQARLQLARRRKRRRGADLQRRRPARLPRHIPPREVPRIGGGQTQAHIRARTALRRKPVCFRRRPRPRGALLRRPGLRRERRRLPRPDGPQLLFIRKGRPARDAAVGLQPSLRHILARRAAARERRVRLRQLPDRRASAA